MYLNWIIVPVSEMYSLNVSELFGKIPNLELYDSLVSDDSGEGELSELFGPSYQLSEEDLALRDKISSELIKREEEIAKLVSSIPKIKQEDDNKYGEWNRKKLKIALVNI